MHQDPIQQHKAASPDSASPESEGQGKSLTPPAFQLKASEGPAAPPPAQLKQSSGGMPTDLVNGFAASTGHDLSDVNVVRNSDKPAQVGALAYAQGNDIHLAAGQDQHLAHEAAHIVQQREGRVQANTEVNGKPVNTQQSLESEADTMGAKATQMKAAPGGGVASTGGYQSKALQMRAGMRTVQMKSAVMQLKEDSKYGAWFDDKNKLQQDGTSRGAEMKVRFKPNLNVNAELIGMVQSVRTIHNGASFFPNNDAFYKGRAIQKDKAIEVNSVSKETDEGTRIDQSKTNRNPLYAPEGAPDTDISLDQTLPDPDVTKSNGYGKHGFRYNEKGASKEQDAELEDSPMIRSVDMSKNSGQIFETTALAIKGAQKDTYYGSVQWGWRTDAAGGFTPIPFKVVSEGVPSSTFLQSAEAWNASKTSTGKETLDLPLETVFLNAAPTSLFSDAEMKTKTKDLPASTRMVNRLCTTHGSYKMRIVDGPDVGKEGYVDQTKIQRER